MPGNLVRPDSKRNSRKQYKRSKTSKGPELTIEERNNP